MGTINSDLLMRKLRLRELVELSLGYAASTYQCQNLDVGLSNSKVHILSTSNTRVTNSLSLSEAGVRG